MGQPAARLGDATAHGGAVTSGNPTVLINGRPAAALGDAHVCPVCSPGPHVGGPVLAGAPTVLIGGKPAARVGDACACAAPAPDVILSGSPNVFIGGASGAASPGLAAALAAAHGASMAPGTPGTGTTARPLSPWVGVGYQDKAGRPVVGWHYRAASGGGGGPAASGGGVREGQVGSGGKVWLDALADGGAVAVGLVGVYGCRWERGEARVGEAVGMSARSVGVADGELALFEVWREATSADGSYERAKVWEVMGEVAGGRIEAATPFVFSWEGVETVAPGGWEGTAPVYVCEVSVGGVHRAQGGRLTLKTWFAFGLDDGRGRPVAGEPYRIAFADGSAREGRLGRAGRARVDDVPAAVTGVEFPNRGAVAAVRPAPAGDPPPASAPPPAGAAAGDDLPLLPPPVP